MTFTVNTFRSYSIFAFYSYERKTFVVQFDDITANKLIAENVETLGM